MTIDTVEQLDEMRARYICKKAGMDAEKHWYQYMDYAVGLREADAAAGIVSIPVRHDSRKADMMGEYKMFVPMFDEDGEEYMQSFNIPWDVMKQIIDGAIKSSPFKT